MLTEEQLKIENEKIKAARLDLEASIKRIQEQADVVAQCNANLVEAQAGFAQMQKDWHKRQTAEPVIEEVKNEEKLIPTEKKVYIRTFTYANKTTQKIEIPEDQINNIGKFGEEYGKTLSKSQLVGVQDMVRYDPIESTNEK